MIMEFNEENLLKVPRRQADEEITKVRRVYIIPGRRNHLNGNKCLDMVAERWNGALIRFAGGRESAELVGEGYKCFWITSRLAVIENTKNAFNITNDLANLKFYVEE